MTKMESTHTISASDLSCMHPMRERAGPPMDGGTLDGSRAGSHGAALLGGTRSLTFDELVRRVRSLSLTIRHETAAAPTDAPVGLCTDGGSTDGADGNLMSVVALLAVLHAQRAYVPFDHAYPAARLRYMADDAAICLLLCVGVRREAVAAWFGGQALEVAVDDAEVVDDEQLSTLRESEWLPAQLLPADSENRPAHILYTSGSTGRPKGVVGLVRAMRCRLDASLKCFPYADGEVGCHKTSLTFVDSVCEILLPLTCGGARQSKGNEQTEPRTRPHATRRSSHKPLLTRDGVPSARPTTWQSRCSSCRTPSVPTQRSSLRSSLRTASRASPLCPRCCAPCSRRGPTWASRCLLSSGGH